MERLEVHHFLAEEAEDIDLFNGMLDRAKCDEILDHLVDPAQVAAFFICGPEPMMDAAEAALSARGVPRDKIHLERFTAGRPPAEIAAPMQALQKEAQGLTMLVTLDGRKRRVAFDAGLGNILDSARSRPAGAVRLQGRRLRHLPRPRRLGRGRDGGALRPHRRGDRDRATSSPASRSPRARASSSITTPEATGLRRTLHAIENGQLLRHRPFCGGGKLWPGESRRGSMNMAYSAVHVSETAWSTRATCSSSPSSSTIFR